MEKIKTDCERRTGKNWPTSIPGSGIEVENWPFFSSCTSRDVAPLSLTKKEQSQKLTYAEEILAKFENDMLKNIIYTIACTFCFWKIVAKMEYESYPVTNMYMTVLYVVVRTGVHSRKSVC